MYVSPSLISGQLAYERQRDMLAQASRERLAHEVRIETLAARRSGGSQRRPGWTIALRPGRPASAW